MEDSFAKTINATYKLLEFFPDNDPLKYKAKERVLKVLEELTLISDASGWISLKKEKASAELLDDIEVLKNYLQLGKNQGWVGGINYLILLKEYDIIKSQIVPPKGAIKQSLAIALGEIRSISLVSEKNKKTIKKESENHLLDVINLPQALLPLKGVEGMRKAFERQQKILAIIKNRGKAQVADIIKEIPKITKRTIRRDLDELLKKSRIVRHGEWNKVFYQLG